MNIEPENDGVWNSFFQGARMLRFDVGVSKNTGTPKWMVYNGETL